MKSLFEKRPQQVILAEFDSTKSLLHAAEKMQAAGYTKYDCHSPFPIHGMDGAMGLKRSPLGYIIGTMGTMADLLDKHLRVSDGDFRKTEFQLAGICTGYFCYYNFDVSFRSFFRYAGYK